MPSLRSLPWPYPRWIAHRGAGKLAPENTLAAFRLGASHGYRMFECDVKLSADGIPFLLHDSGLDRTTNSTGVAGQQNWHALSQLDAGSWHSPRYAGEPLATLEAVARFCLQNGLHINLEIKPTPGTERQTADVVARHARHLWHAAAVPPLLSSFEPDALASAQVSAPDLPRALLLSAMRTDWLEVAQGLDCVAVTCHHSLWTPALVQQAHALGLRCLSYTVNEENLAHSLLAMGLDGLITDRVDVFAAEA